MRSLLLQLTLVCLLAVALVAGSCKGPAGPAFGGLAPTTAGSADVYLYRGHALAAIGDAFTVRVDGERVGALYDASYLQLALSPGQHRVEVAPGGVAAPIVIDFVVKTGGRDFYEFRFPTGLQMRPSFSGAAIVPVDQGPALAALVHLRGAAPAPLRLTDAAYRADPASAP